MMALCVFFQQIFFWIFPFDTPQNTPKTTCEKKKNKNPTPSKIFYSPQLGTSIIHAIWDAALLKTVGWLEAVDLAKDIGLMWTEKQLGPILVGLRVGHCRKEPKEIAEEKGRFFFLKGLKWGSPWIYFFRM